MARRLATHVVVDGVSYGPDADVSDEVAERITNPNVWADDAEPAAEAEIKSATPHRSHTKRN